MHSNLWVEETFQDFLGIKLDPKKNSVNSKNLKVISADTSKVQVLVIPTNEELEIAKQSVNLF